MSKKQMTTFCRICDAFCGLVADVEDGRITGLRPDKNHPVTKGFACQKGLCAFDIHHDEDRLNFPMKRINGRNEDQGIFEQVSWDASAKEISDKIKEITSKYGQGALGVYFGNPVAFNSLFFPPLGSFCLQTGCHRLFGAATQDCSNKFAAGEAIFGTNTLHPIPDISNTDYCLIIGENPKVSKMTFISISDPIAKLKSAQKRGAKIRFVNPRRIESSDDGVGEVIQVKPDTDVYLLAAILCDIKRTGGFREDIISEHGKNLNGLKEFIKDYPPERVAPVVGIPSETICEIARDFMGAESASIHMSTGSNMGRQGTLCYWLVQMLSFVTGNLDKRGGNICLSGFIPAAKIGKTDVSNLFFDSPFGEMRTVMGCLPGNLLADMITAEKDPIRALFVISGNPLLTVGGEQKLRKAFKDLELVVCLDIYRNATGELADYLLPCADMLERSDINLLEQGMQPQPYVQFVDAVVPPCYERKEIWWILARIEKEMGLNSVLNQDDVNLYGHLNEMLSHSDLSLEKLKSLPSQTAVLPKPEVGRFFADHLQTEDKKIDCCPKLFEEAMKKAAVIFEELNNEPKGQLKLISLRNRFMHNSWFHNIEKLKKGEHTVNPIYINPNDADRLNVKTGSKVDISNEWGRITATVSVDDRLRQGVVAMAHGWGNSHTFGMKIARKYPGVNVNRLLPSGPGSYEKLSNQAHMTGIPVEIVPR